MLESLRSRFFDKDFEADRKGFYLGAMAAFVMLSVLCVIAAAMRYGLIPVFTLMMGVVLVVILAYFGHVTGRYALFSCLILLLVNFLVLPGVYVMRMHTVNSISVFFALSSLLCIVMLSAPLMYVFSLLSLAVFIAVQLFVYSNGPGEYYGGYGTPVTLIEIIISVLGCGLLAGMCIRFRIRFYLEEKEKAEAQRKLAIDAEEAKNVFLSNMSHEMRTPMNAILGNAQMLMEAEVDEAGRSEAINLVNACNALLFTIEDLMDFSYDKEGKPSIHEEDYDLYNLLDDVVNMATISMIDRPSELSCAVMPGCPALFGDSKRIRQVIVYIISGFLTGVRAGRIGLDVSYAVNGGGYVGLTILIAAPREATDEAVNYGSLSAGAGDILQGMEGKVTVDRTESGVKAFHIELTQKIAQKRRSDSRQTEPAGGERRKVLVFEKSREDYEVLEKAIIDCGGEVHQVGSVRDFIREQKNGGWDYLFIDHDKYMGIREELDSIPEKGRLVVLTDIAGSNIGECPGIMLIRPAYYTNISALFSKRIHPSLRRSAMAVRAAFKGIRAMAVDDNMTNLSVLCALLKKYDLEVYTASGGMECLNRLRNQEVDIIFMDYMMPGMDGIDTLKCIREMDEEWAKKVPVVAVTANAVAGIREKLLGEGFDDYLTKPVEINRLENCIGRFFSERQK